MLSTVIRNTFRKPEKICNQNQIDKLFHDGKSFTSGLFKLIFVETEKQVGAHLQSHLNKLPEQDVKSRAVVQQMYIDESQHADMALELGAAELPLPVKLAMQLSGKIMTQTAYWV